MQKIETGENGNSPTEAQPDAAASNAVTDFDRAMMEIGRSYRTFPRINRRAYQSSLGAFEINVFAHGDVSAYRSIHPETTGTVAKLDVGTVIVREVLGTNGEVTKLTLMAKGPAGYDDTLGDWWFGEADPQGTPTRMGRLADCHGCHIPRASADYLFGVPKDAER
jgi:hypothetical protein